jgi:membrane peptidoglycan carboxypeptidase
MSNWLSRFTPRVGSWIGLGLVSSLAGVMVAVMLTPLMAISGVTLKNTVGVFDTMPDFIALDQLAQTNDIYAQTDEDPANGYLKIASVYWQNRKEVGWDGVSQFLKDAAVAGEDRRFYEHRGVDLQGIVRAAFGNVVSGGVQSGASTLTMQVIKNVYVQRAEALPTEEERTAAYAEATATSFQRKFKEIKLALGLEKRYGKEQILLAYLNISSFGGNTYGVESAAQLYFGKSAADVTVAEAASLIAIVQYPMLRNLSDPANFEANQARRDVVLAAMHDEGYITDAQYAEAIAIPVDENFVHLTEPLSGCIAADKYAKWFCDYVVKNVTNFEALGTTPEERLSNWHIGGYKLYTTMNYKLQVIAQKKTWIVPKNETKPKIGAAEVSLEVGTGRVLTMTNNKLFNDTLQGGGKDSSAVNFATDRDYGGSSGFQTGSTYKIFGLLAWLQAGHGLNELVDASEFTKDQSQYLDTCTDGGGPWGGKWEFRNDAKAPKAVSVLDATRASINSAFASIGEKLDQCAIRQAAISLGVHRADNRTLKTNPSAILGTNELAPISLAAAFAGMANDGKYCAPIVLNYVVGPTGEELPGQTPKCSQGISPDVAHGAIYAMKRVMSGGTGSASNPRDGVPIFGKTGTTDSSNQTWIVTSTSRVASVVWVGNIVGKYPMRQFPGGAQFRHRIMATVMRAANKMYTGEKNWPTPPSKMLAGSSVTVPSLRGLTVEAATTLLKGLGFEVAVGPTMESDLASGLVVMSDPAEGSKLAQGMTITLTPSLQIATFIMPDFITTLFTQEAAEAAMQNLGATSPRLRCEEAADPADPLIGSVISQYPAAGAELRINSYWRISILRETCENG